MVEEKKRWFGLGKKGKNTPKEPRRVRRVRKDLKKDIAKLEGHIAKAYRPLKKLTIAEHLKQARGLIPKKGLTEGDMSNLIMVKGHLSTLDDLYEEDNEKLSEEQHKTLVGLHHVLGSTFNALGHQALSMDEPDLGKAKLHFQLAEEHLSHVQSTLKNLKMSEDYYKNIVDEWSLDSLEDLGQKIAKGKRKHKELMSKV